TGVRTAERITARLTPLRLADELDLDGLLVGADRLGSLEQLAHRLPALFAVVAGEVVHVHPHEPVGEPRVQPAPELERVLHPLLAVVEPGPDRGAQAIGEHEDRAPPKLASSP